MNHHTHPQTPAPPHHTPQATPPPRKNTHHRESIRGMLSTVGVLIAAPLIALLLITFVFHSYRVDGPSMQTTLEHNDHLIVWKLPRTWARITGHNFLPERGDIVVFDHGLGTDYESGSKQVIKRVIALPGERVVVQDGSVTVYSQEHPEGFAPDQNTPYGPNTSYTAGDVDLIVPAGEIFVLGDNRANSFDSRSFGPVAADNIVGVLGIRVFPFKDFRVY